MDKPKTQHQNNRVNSSKTMYSMIVFKKNCNCRQILYVFMSTYMEHRILVEDKTL